MPATTPPCRAQVPDELLIDRVVGRRSDPGESVQPACLLCD